MLRLLIPTLLSVSIVAAMSIQAYAGSCGAEVNRVFELKQYYDSVPSSNRAEKRNAAQTLEEQQARAVECAHNETNNSEPDPFITKMRNNYKVN